MKYKTMSENPIQSNNAEKQRLDQCLENINTDLLERNINVAQYGERISGLMLFEFGVLSIQELNERF
jgi:hypothetical protein